MYPIKVNLSTRNPVCNAVYKAHKTAVQSNLQIGWQSSYAHTRKFG